MQTFHDKAYIIGHLKAVIIILTISASVLGGEQGKPTSADLLGPDSIVYPDFSRAGRPGGIPEVKVVANVVDFGAIPNDDKDDSAAIQAAVLAASAKGGGAVLLPAGDYLIDHPIVLERNGVVIRGADREKTRLVARFAGRDLSNSSPSESVIVFRAPRIQRRYDVYPSQPVKRGDTIVHLPDKMLGQVRGGDVVTFTATPPTDVIAMLSPECRKLATDGSYGSIYSWQYLEVKSVEGNTVTFDRPIRLDVAMDQKPKLMHVPAMVADCGVENLTITQSVASKGINGVSMNSARGCWIKDVTILKIGNWPLGVDRSWEFEIRDCRFDDSLSRGGAVAYVGFSFACDGLGENVTMTRLRHLSISMACNGLVFRNCFLENIDINFHLHWPYEVLFENCRVDAGLGPNATAAEEGRGSYGYGIYTPRADGAMHNPAGPRLTFYHNDISNPWDGIMLGGGGTRNTIVAYNRFRVQASFAAVIRRGSDDSIFQGNVFSLADPHKRKQWMKQDAYGHQNPESLRGAVWFPHGAPEGLRFIGNTFYVPEELPLYVGGQPAVNERNKVIVTEADTETKRISLAGEWRVRSVNLVALAATPDACHVDPGTSLEAKQLLAADVADSDWPKVAMPTMLTDTAAPLDRQDGEVVLRYRFDVPEQLLNKKLVLSLGAIDDHDETWLNGKQVGATIGKNAWNKSRLYEVPAGLLRPTGNVLAVRIWDAFGAGGMGGSKRDLWIGEAPQVKVDQSEVPTPPVPSLYEWQKSRQRAKF